jgi:hypothetical protein
VRTYPSHSSILYTLNPKHAGCEYPNDTSWQHGFQASTMVCGHSIHFRSNRYGQIGMTELGEHTSIGGSKSKASEQSGADRNNGNKNRKKVQYYCSTPHQWSMSSWTNSMYTAFVSLVYKWQGDQSILWHQDVDNRSLPQGQGPRRPLPTLGGCHPS